MGKSGVAALSKREREVLEAVHRGLSTKEIAHELSLSPSTVDGYANTATRKLGAPNRRHAGHLLASAQTPLTPPKNLIPENLRVVSDSEIDASPLPSRVEEERVSFVPFDPASEGHGRSAVPRDGLRTATLIVLIALAIAILLLALKPLAEAAADLANSIDPITLG